MEISNTINAFMPHYVGEMQRGSLPPIMFGDAPLAISGYAMDSLRGSMADKATPLVNGEQSALTQIAEIWADHFATGAFEGVELSGQGTNRQWFNEVITPDMIMDLPMPIITLVPDIPQDRASKINMAQMSRSGPNGVPLYSDLDIHENILEDQDADRTMAGIFQQMGEQLNPFAMLDVLIASMKEMGENQKAQYYEVEKMMQLQQMMMQLQGMGGPPGGAPPGQSNLPRTGGAQPGMPAQTAPGPVQGIPSPTPTPQAGPLVPPGTPRPGAQNGSSSQNGSPLGGP